MLSLSSNPGPRLGGHVFVFIGIAWLWFLCISPRVTAPDNSWPNVGAKAFWRATPLSRFILFGLLLFVVYIVCVYLPIRTFEDLLVSGELRRGRPRTAPTRAILVAMVGTLFFSIFLLIVARFLLIFPAMNNCERWSLLDTWRRTRGVTWRLWLTIWMACITAWIVPAFLLRIVAIGMHAIDTTLPELSFVIISVAVDVLATILSVGTLEIFFRSWIVLDASRQTRPKPGPMTIGVR